MNRPKQMKLKPGLMAFYAMQPGNSSRMWDVDISGSSDVYTHVVPRTQSQTGDRSFFVAGPRLWNNLPTDEEERHYVRTL